VRCPPFEEYVDTIVEYASQRLKGRRDAKQPDDVPDPLG
jgi:hypothetical protein